MTVLTLTITDAGRNALVNAANTGTLPLALNKVILGRACYVPTAAQQTLHDPIKPLTTFGGSQVADDTIHITITDDSQDAYSLGEIGLYSGEVLFAVYSQALPILEKGPEQMVLLSADIQFLSLPANSITVGSTEFAYPQSNELRPGVLEIATPDEATTGKDHTRAITPLTLKQGLDTKLGKLDAAVAAAKWSTARQFVISGDGTGMALVDGSGNVVLQLEVNDNSHGHTIENVSGLATALSNKLAATANAVSASRWATSRLFKISGNANGQVYLDGSGDVELNLRVTKVGDSSISPSSAVTSYLGSFLEVGNAAGSHSGIVFHGQNSYSANIHVNRDDKKLYFHSDQLYGNSGKEIWHAGNFDPNNKFNTSGGSLSGPIGVKTINGQGSSIGWASMDIGGIKGGYAGFNFTEAGHWFGIRPDGLSGLWSAGGTAKWYFTEDGSLCGGAKVPWDIVTNHPGQNNWATKNAGLIVGGQLAWKNYGNGHTIFDASAGSSPDGTSIDKFNAQIAWRNGDAGYPSLMGWNGVNTYGVRVDSARRADSASSAETAIALDGGIIKTKGQDLSFWDKRALVGSDSENVLHINYGSDWGTTRIHGNVDGIIQANAERTVLWRSGSSSYIDAHVEARTANGTTQTPRIALHRPAICAASFRLELDNTVCLETADPSVLAPFAAARMFASSASPTQLNELTRKDYVDAGDYATRWNNSQVINHTGGDANAHYNSAWDGNAIANAPTADWYFFREAYHSNGGNWRHQEALAFFTDDEWFRRGEGTAGQYGPWRRRWHSGNFDPASKADAGHTHSSLATARTITLASELAGSASFDGSKDITINATSVIHQMFSGASDSVTFSLAGTVGNTNSVIEVTILDGTAIAIGHLPLTIAKQYPSGYSLYVDYGDSADFVIMWTYNSSANTLTLTNTGRGDFVRVVVTH